MAFDETITRGTTSKRIEVIMRDATTGQGLTGISPASLTAYYVVEAGTATAHTQPTSGSPGAAYSAGVFAEIDSTNMPGVYQFHLDNAMFSGSHASVTLTLVYTGALTKNIRFCVIEADLRDATDLGLANLDAAISTRSTVAATDIVSSGAITTNGGAVSNVTLVATTTTNTDMRGTDSAFLAASAPANFSSLGITAAGAIDDVVLVATTTTNSDMRGTDGANTVAPDNAGIQANGTAIGNIANGTSQVTLADASLAKFATFNTGVSTPSAGSIALLSQGSAGGNVTVGDLTQAALAKFANTDTGETTAVSGSVAALAQGSSGGNVTVDAFTQNALDDLITDATSTSTVASNSVAGLIRENVVPSQDGINKFADTALTASTIANSVVDKAKNTATEIANAVWDALYASHTIAGSFGKLLDQLRKSNRAIDGEVAGTPTAGAFDTNITGYVTGAFDNELLVFVGGTLNGEARPIASYDATNGRITLQTDLTAAPTAADEFVILPYHTYSIEDIQNGLATSSELATVIKTGQAYTATAQSGDTIQVTIT